MNIVKAQNSMNSFIGKRFKYGQFDCLVFSIKVLESFHEISIQLPLKYDGSRKSIAKLFKRYKAKTLDKLVQNYCLENKWTEVQKNYLQPFDLLILKVKKENVFAIWDGEKAMSVCKTGYGVVFDYSFSKAFRIKKGI
ncbi:MAG: hypothetical protein JKY89_12945 [Immundisolibacteraceae bacterium]|nr:hypothetical protein [Immundisolibacteraceae bacterium]